MPIFQVTAPDGRKYRVTAPEGATPDQALQYAQQNYQTAQDYQPEPGTAGQYGQSNPEPIRVRLPDGKAVEFPAGTSRDVMESALQRYQTDQPEGGPWHNFQPVEPTPTGGGRSLAALKASSPAYASLSDDEFSRRVYQKFYADKMSYGDFQSRTGQSGSNRLQQIETALRAADAAGNVDDARRLAQAYAAERDGIENNANQRGAGSPGAGHGYGMAAPEAADPTQVPQARAPLNAQSGPKRADFSNVQSHADTRPAKGPQVAWGGPGGLAAPKLPMDRAPQTIEQVNLDNRAYNGSEQQRRERLAYERSQAAAKRADFQSLPAPLRFGIGVGSRVAAAGRGVGQLYALAADEIAPRQSTLSDAATGQSPSRYAAAMRAEAEARKDQQYMAGDTAATLGGVAGDVGLLAAPGAAVGRLRGLAALAGNAALGAGYSGLQPLVEGESRAKSTAVGGAFGAAGHGLASGVSRVGRHAASAIPEDLRHLARRANELGIPLHAGQVSQSLPVKVTASAGKYLPFSGYGKAASRQQEAINRAVAKTFGADAPKLSDDVMQQARRKLSDQFEDIYNRNAVPITEQGARKLAQVEREASRRLTNDEAQVLRNQFDDILENSKDGVLTGQKYQAVRTALRKAEGNDKLGMAVRELRQTLDDIAAEAVGPSDSAALKALRANWANFRTVEKALQQNAGAGGNVRLAALWPLIRKGSTKEMRELARMGQTLLKDPIADSGTAQRTLAYNLLMGGGSIANPAMIPLIAKAAAGGATVGRAANSNTLAKFLIRESRGKPTSRLGQLLERGVPYAAPAAARQYTGGGGR